LFLFLFFLKNHWWWGVLTMKPDTVVLFVHFFKKYEGAIVIGAIFIFSLALFSYHVLSGHHAALIQNKQGEIVLRELSAIQSELKIALHHTRSQKQQAVLSTLQQELLSVQQSITATAKVSDIQKVSGEIASVKDDVDLQMSDIKKAMAGTSNGKQYLEASTLPFHIVSVDSIAGLPYVSVDYEHHVSPLAVGDQLAGWQVVAANNDVGVAEFVNDKNQYVKVLATG
jgi:hypothetical protein